MEPLALAMICDDVRVESNGKPFIIGVYPTDILFPALPAVLPQLVAIVTLVSDIDKPIRKFSVQVTCPGTDQSTDFELPPPPEPIFPDSTRVEVRVAVNIRPFVVVEPGTLTVMVKYEGGELRARRMPIRVVTPQPEPEYTPTEAARDLSTNPPAGPEPARH
jgi:hypothetical protein